jgi:hypothetical protein
MNDSMTLYRRDPCRECPYRRAAPAGYMGGHDPRDYAQFIRFQIPVACHLTVGEKATGEPRLCTGAAQAVANSCGMPRDPHYAAQVQEAGRNPDVFSFAIEFERHHLGEGG